jgi:hypothetical protein
MAVKLLSSSGGSVTIDVPVTASNFALTLPAANGTVITTGSSGQSIPKAALPTGSVLQVVSATYATDTTTTSTSYVATGLTASITPIFSSSKIFIVTTFPLFVNIAAASGYATLYRGASNLFNDEGAFRLENGASGTLASGAISYFDSPATTSSTTYQVYFKSQISSLQTRICFSNATAVITLMEIAA